MYYNNGQFNIVHFFELTFRIFGGNMKFEVNTSDNHTRIYIKENISKENVKKYVPSEIIYNKLSDYLNIGIYEIINDEGNIVYIQKNDSLINIITEKEDLEISDKYHYYRYKIGISTITSNSSDEEKEDKIPSLIKFARYIDFISIKNGSRINLSFVLQTIRIWDESRATKLIEGDNLFLSLGTFKSASSSENNLDIIKKNTLEVIGQIEFVLQNKNKDNFLYSGNVSYEIYPKYRNNGYATDALGLLKKFVKENLSEYNNDLYISTTRENIYSQKVALNNGAVLYKDTDVPKCEPLYYMGKISHVLVYKI